MNDVKQSPKTKKLKLNKKTIRALDEQQLDGVVGAGTICCNDTCQGICTSEHKY